MSLISSLSSLPIINAVGYATRVGGSAPSPEVLDAMRWAQEHYFEIDDLLHHAWEVIARETGSEGGLVTCSASAALTLGAAAMMAGYDPGVMEALPNTRGVSKKQFLYSSTNEYDYDHPIRASGAELVPFPFEEEGLEERLSLAITGATAGIVFVWTSRHQQPLIRRIGAFCRQHRIPFLLDAAMGLPPAENLRQFYALGANLVALSGGKHLEGPQNSGLLFGDADLVLSAWLQMVDMHVQPDVWSHARLIRQGIIAKPPRHGIGRGFKVGKDAIVGCLAALQAYAKRDFAAEAARWHARCRTIMEGLAASETFRCELLEKNGTGQYPAIRLTACSASEMTRLKHGLKTGSPKIVTAEDDHAPHVAYLYPMCLEDRDLPVLIERVNHLISPPLNIKP